MRLPYRIKESISKFLPTSPLHAIFPSMYKDLGLPVRTEARSPDGIQILTIQDIADLRIVSGEDLECGSDVGRVAWGQPVTVMG